MTARNPDGVALVPDVPALLAALGGTADEVAASLRQLGVKGVPDDPDSCPLAQLMKLGVSTPIVSTRKIFWGPAHECSMHITAPLLAFVIAFDRGAYPDLVEVSP